MFYDYSYWWCTRNETADNMSNTYMWIYLNFKDNKQECLCMKVCYVSCVYMLPPVPASLLWLERKRKPVFSSSTCSFLLIFKSLVLLSFSRASHCVKKKMQCISCQHRRCFEPNTFSVVVIVAPLVHFKTTDAGGLLSRACPAPPTCATKPDLWKFHLFYR